MIARINRLTLERCVGALSGALHKFGPPEIMDTEQVGRFTAFAWTHPLNRVATQLSMDGKGRCLDNIFLERLW